MDMVIEKSEEVVSGEEEEEEEEEGSEESRQGQASIPAAEIESATALLQRERRRSSVAKPPPPPPTKSTRKAKQHKAQKASASQLLELALQADTESDSGAPPTIPRPPPMSALPRSLPLLVCSVGNPGAQYANTLHSAGHTVLNKLAAQLGYQQFSKDRSMGNGLVSKPQFSGAGGDWALWQSTAYMNESGKGVRAAYQAWSKALADGEGRLVVVHDELEKPLGAVSLRTAQGLSAKGHNGLKSIISLMGNTPFARIGIGIGRPVSRQSDEVARYVLKKMDAGEKAAIDGSVEQVIAKLKLLESGKG